MLGTPYYMSPEQWGELPDDGNHEIDGRADIYSLGVVIYELIAAKRPFSGFSLPELRRQHTSLTPPPLHELDPGVSQAFSDAVARAIAKDRSGRQATAGELEQELVAALAAEGIVASASVANFASEPTPGGSHGTVTSPQQTASTLVTGIGETDPVRAPAPTIASQAATMPTVLAQPSASAPPLASPPVGSAVGSGGPMAAAVTPPAKGKGKALIFAGVGLVVLLLIAGVGGYFVMHTMMNKTDANVAQTNSSSNPAGGAEVVGAHEIGRYWLQVNSDSESNSVRAAEDLQMASGQQFRFHFSPSQNGYLYIIGPGEGNVPMTFLTTKPGRDFGVKNNEVKSGQDFVFPADTRAKYNWLNLDETAGTDEFTIIFSGTPLTTPAFLDEEALRALSESDLAELNQATAGFKSNFAGIEVMKNVPAPFVSVKVPQSAAEGAPVVFKLKIAHK
ncbi:MAG TPA: DUF4384 domain-containing protein, partial [Pyrinomonadaceae bacterium]|nr:DUF4384 domain-containing protein [Pyrinomonadaceae bacterium]